MRIVYTHDQSNLIRHKTAHIVGEGNNLHITFYSALNVGERRAIELYAKRLLLASSAPFSLYVTPDDIT